MVCSQDKRLVPGGGATEIELAKQITSYGEVQMFFCSMFFLIYIYIYMLLNKKIHIYMYLHVNQ